MLVVVFWISFAIIFYTYMGYGILLWIITKIIPERKVNDLSEDNLPAITHVIAAYNEEECIEEKIQNSLSMRYPVEKVNHIIVADGSIDATVDIVKKYSDITLHFLPERNGKLAAINRVLPMVETEVVILSDANSFISDNAFRDMVRHFSDDNVGVVAGEKSIVSAYKDDASSAGENFYWKYESKLKLWDAQLHSAIGAVGELYAIRSSLYKSPSEDTLIEDFVTSMKIAMTGYRIAYEPKAKAMEKASLNVSEEFKRKIRISAGGLQSLWKLRSLLNPFKFGILSFQYISHQVLRRTLAPLSIILLFLCNLYLVTPKSQLYIFTLLSQVVFYFLAMVGFFFRNYKTDYKFIFIPFYFVFMNLSVLFGLIKLIRGDFSVNWEKAVRK